MTNDNNVVTAKEIFVTGTAGFLFGGIIGAAPSIGLWYWLTKQKTSRDKKKAIWFVGGLAWIFLFSSLGKTIPDKPVATNIPATLAPIEDATGRLVARQAVTTEAGKVYVVSALKDAMYSSDQAFLTEANSRMDCKDWEDKLMPKCTNGRPNAVLKLEADGDKVYLPQCTLVQSTGKAINASILIFSTIEVRVQSTGQIGYMFSGLSDSSDSLNNCANTGKPY